MRESMQQEQIQPSENADPYLQGRPLVESVVMSDGDRNSENEMVLDMDIRDDSPEESNPYVDEFARSAQKNKQPHLKKSKNRKREEIEEPLGSSLVCEGQSEGLGSSLVETDTINPQDKRKSSAHKPESGSGGSLKLVFKKPSEREIAES